MQWNCRNFLYFLQFYCTHHYPLSCIEITKTSSLFQSQHLCLHIFLPHLILKIYNEAQIIYFCWLILKNWLERASDGSSMILDYDLRVQWMRRYEWFQWFYCSYSSVKFSKKLKKCNAWPGFVVGCEWKRRRVIKNPK